MRYLAVLFALVLVACAPPPKPAPSPPALPPTYGTPVHVDDAFDEHDRGEILRAVDAWNATLRGQVVLAPRVERLTLLEQGVLIMRITSEAKYIPGPRVLGFVEHQGGRLMWLVRDRMTPDRVYPVTLHELGHVLGAPDRDTPGLMHRFFYADQYRCIDAATVTDVARWLGLHPVTLRPSCNSTE